MTISETREPSREEWRRIRALAEEALGLAPEEQDALLARRAAGEPRFERAVRRLLELDRLPDAFDVPASGAHATKPAERIGAYLLRRCLGSGGMGSVWLAVQDDGDFRRSVALKLLHPSLGREELLGRFQRERQVLANLEHPGIARLIDGGMTAEGVPYLVMEYVEGLRIDRWCEQQGLALRARLELFLAVCDAVQHAHERLVVHRDLKPGNILVTAAGQPKLLDFGIAKVLDPEKQAWSEVTQGVMRFFTPSYASPEQIQGRPVTTASDVYSLGVLAYQLLTGHLPHRLETTSSAEIVRVITEVEPERPSVAVRRPIERRRATDTRRLSRALAGDLDRIVLKALRPEPLRRYPTVHELAEDVRAYLAGRPVSARPDGALYRSSRFLRRNALAASLVGLLALALCAGLAAALVQNRATARARDDERAQRELAESRLAKLETLSRELGARNTALEEQRAELGAALAEGRELGEDLERERGLAESRFGDIRRFTTTLLFDVYDRVRTLPGATAASGQLLRTGLEYLDRLALQSAGDPALQRELAAAYLQLSQHQAGAYQANTGELEPARASLAKAAALLQELAPERSELAPERSELALGGEPARADRSLLARVEIARGDLERLRPEGSAAARTSYVRAIDALAPFEHDETASARERYDLAAAISRLGELSWEQGELGQAEDAYARAQLVLEDLLARQPGLPAFENDLSILCMRLGQIVVQRGERERGLDLAREGVARAEDLVRAHPTDALLARQLLMARFQLADLLGFGAELEEGRALFELACADARRALAADPANDLAQRDFVLTFLHAAGVEAGAGAWERAAELCREALPVAKRRLGEHGAEWMPRFELAQVHLDLGRAELELGRELEAGAELGQVAVLLEALGEPPRTEASMCRYYAQTAHRLGTALRLHAEAGSDAGEPADPTRLAPVRHWLTQAEVALQFLEEEGHALPSDREEHDALRAELVKLDGRAAD